jgi:Terminase small subunit
MDDKPNELAVVPGQLTEPLREKLHRLLGEPDAVEVICGHVSNGGTVIGLAKTWGVPASSVFGWLRKDPDRNKRYQQALLDRKEWLIERLHQEMYQLSTSDLRALYTPAGELKPVTEWPDEIAVAVQSVETDELFEGTGRERQQIGITRKVRFWDKNKSLEQLAKLHQLLTEKIEHSGQMTLGDLILLSYDREKKLAEPKQD